MGKNSIADIDAQDRVAGENDENQERGNWTGKLDFLLSTIGFAVGLGNVWRFPYKAAANGGGSFLIPYVVALIFAGLPLFFMEMAFGQFSSQGPISVWNAVPLFKGVGYGMVVISALVVIYYNMIIAYTLYYLFASFTSTLPWSECSDEWIEKYNCTERISDDEIAGGCVDHGNCTTGGKTPSELYFTKTVLDISTGIEDAPDEMKWQLVLCLLLAWIMVFVCLSRGIKSSGKVVYFTATFPYLVLLILLIRNVMLPGAVEGIKFYIIPEWDKLKDIQVWYTAASQIFYSLGVAFGGLETMASYNRFHNNIHRDALIVAVLNCCTSVFAGFVIFSVVGYMAEKAGIPVEDMADQGPGLAFIAYPEGLASMPIAPLWSILFFVMLLTLGLDSQFAMMETVISAIVDEFTVLRTKKRKMVLTLVLCVVFFLLGLPQCSRNGIYILNLFEWYSAAYGLIIVCLLELLAIVWAYGWRRFCEDIEMMIGHKPNYYWLVNWLVLTPIYLMFILLYSLIKATRITYQDYVYPEWVDAIGWGMGGLALIFVPILAFVEYCKAHGFLDTMKRVLSPTPTWGPAVEANRTGIYADDSMSKAKGTNNPSFDDGDL